MGDWLICTNIKGKTSDECTYTQLVRKMCIAHKLFPCFAQSRHAQIYVQHLPGGKKSVLANFKIKQTSA